MRTMNMDKHNITHHLGRYVRPRVSLIGLENTAYLLQGSDSGDSQVNYVDGTVQDGADGSTVPGGSFGYGGENNDTDDAE